MSGSTAIRTAIMLIYCTFTMQGAFAQEMPQTDFAAPSIPNETGNQVDITSGLAEQSAMHASRFSPRGYNSPEFQNYASGQPYSQGQALQGFASQNLPAQQLQQVCPANSQYPQQACNQYAPAQQYPQQSATPPGCAAPQSGSNFSSAFNQQTVGVLGAAVLLNYMSNGGIQNLMGEMGSRGWNNRFRTMGPGGVVFH